MLQVSFLLFWQFLFFIRRNRIDKIIFMLMMKFLFKKINRNVGSFITGAQKVEKQVKNDNIIKL